MDNLFAFTNNFCSQCTTITPHRIVRGEGCLARICLTCERKYHGTESDRQADGDLHSLFAQNIRRPDEV